ncbi:hypothetical protein HPB50_003273 [Hyalomma asiaticum]|uniref:Uncharacterized protein n=1 Tax=Hyalomma asiaticum TaxID=266040 RepID=A0ACB7S0I0_HYAAI|nr:hypothetical protein HPB50_003273 [Hyalomma asiaticum]
MLDTPLQDLRMSVTSCATDSIKSLPQNFFTSRHGETAATMPLTKKFVLAVQATAVAADRLNAQDPVTKLLHSGRTGGQKKCTKPATMPSAVAEAQRCTEGGRAPGFRGRILRVTGTSRVGGLQVGTLYQECFDALWGHDIDRGHDELTLLAMSSQCTHSIAHSEEMHRILRRIVQLMSSIVVLAHKEAAARERAAAQEGIMSELHSLAQTMALQQERN